MKYLVIYSLIFFHPGKVKFLTDKHGKETGVKATKGWTVWMDYSRPFPDSVTAYHFVDSIKKVKNFDTFL